MKKILMVTLVFALTLSLGLDVAFALTGNDGRKLSGPHYQFNIIGKPSEWVCQGNCAESNGKTIMIDLETETLRIREYPLYPEECPNDYTDLPPIIDDERPVGKKNTDIIKYTQDDVANKTKIYFNDSEMCDGVDGFDIVDRDATAPDLEAHICLPVGPAPEGAMLYNVYVRILGKPNKCMDINGLVHYTDTTGGDGFYDTGWYWSGSVVLARKGGKSIFINVDDLFDIWWCTDWNVNDDGSLTCTDAEEYSVFNEIFDGYMWQINNYGVRNVQVRLYPVVN